MQCIFCMKWEKENRDLSDMCSLGTKFVKTYMYNSRKYRFLQLSSRKRSQLNIEKPRAHQIDDGFKMQVETMHVEVLLVTLYTKIEFKQEDTGMSRI